MCAGIATDPRWLPRGSLTLPARGRAPPRHRRCGSCRVACEANAGELPALFRLEKIAVGPANVVERSRARAAAQHHLVAHELAIVFPKSARRRAVPGIRRVGAAGPFPNIAKHLLQT